MKEYRCKFCGAPTYRHPHDQDAPADYCDHEGEEPEDEE